MINLNEIRPIQSKVISGQLIDGKLVSLRPTVPSKFDEIMKIAVAISNTNNGGIIIFGVKAKKLDSVGLYENIDNKIRPTIVGLHVDIDTELKNINLAFEQLTIGVSHKTHTIEIEHNVIILIEIEQAHSTALYYRKKTANPERQSAYHLERNAEGFLDLRKTEMLYSAIYKYMTLEAFLLSLYKSHLRFFEPSKWDDKYEQRFYCADYTKLQTDIGNTPQLFASCFTKKKNNEASWKVYAHGQGLSCHCVQLKLDIVELRKQIRASDSVQYFEERIVTYKDEKTILELHNKNSKYYQQYFSSFSRNKFLDLLSLKRDAYSYEQEIRLFIIPKKSNGKRNKHKGAQYADVKLNWSRIIKEVRFDKKCSDAERISLISACLCAGINPLMSHKPDVNISSPNNNCINIPFKEFDIDDMPGTKCITIN